MSNQFLRKCSLIVYGAPAAGSGPPSSLSAAPNDLPTFTGTTITVSKPAAPVAAQPGLDLSQFRIQFKVDAIDENVPPSATIRVFNLADSTAQRVQKEFQNVTLQAGYVGGNFGVIFQGSVIRVRKGRLSNIDTFVDIIAGNLDAVYNYGVVSGTVKAGASKKVIANAIQSGVASSPAAQGTPNALAAGVQYGNIPDSFGVVGGALPRGKVLFGLARDHWDTLADSAGCTWSVGPDGKINFIPLTGVLPGVPVPITSQSGMIGVPEATQNGIEIRTLLNPSIKNGTRIWLDNASINTTTNVQNAGLLEFSGAPPLFANVSNDGYYRAIVVEHEGDTRGSGGDWITKITALSVDQSAAPASSVQAYG